MKKKTQQNVILYLSTYPPRQCGIATFTQNLRQAVDQQTPRGVGARVIAINKDKTKYYQYSRQVLHQVVEGSEYDFIEMAERINVMDNVKIVHVQHEFGLFGGEYGGVVLSFLGHLKKPAVVTFHTVLPHPEKGYLDMTKQVSGLVDHIVVMNKTAKHLLHSVYGIDEKKMTIIPHGIPNIAPYDQQKAKERIGYSERFLLSSFGLLNPNKGLEVVIDALPTLVKKIPSVLYLIIGQTHPDIIEQHVEQYRKTLRDRVQKNGLEEHVKFYNEYLSEKDIIKYLQATDVYISASTQPDQIVSGTLSYAIGAGKAVVSTPFLHAKEYAESGLCRLASFNNPKSFSQQIQTLLSNKEERHELEEHVYAETRHMTWENVGLAHATLYNKITPLTDSADDGRKLPRIRLDHLLRLSDDFGVIQFSKRISPDRASGYSVDDGSRALIALCTHWSVFKKRAVFPFMDTYVQFIDYVQDRDGTIHNMVSIDRVVDTKDWSRDAHARTMWSLGYLMNTKGLPRPFKERASTMFEKSLKVLSKLDTPRSISFAIAGMYFMNKQHKQPHLIKKIIVCADELVARYQDHSQQDWHWFEEHLSYSNSKLSEALFYAYAATGVDEYKKVAVESFDFLREHTIYDGVFHPIGQDGWYVRGKERATHDQQPVDVAAMVQTCLIAYQLTKKEQYKREAEIVYSWFLGKNVLQQMMYDSATGGSYDGLHTDRVNLNQGAESTIVHILARLALEKGSVLL